jgi:hypothetical protein
MFIRVHKQCFSKQSGVPVVKQFSITMNKIHRDLRVEGVFFFDFWFKNGTTCLKA